MAKTTGAGTGKVPKKDIIFSAVIVAADQLVKLAVVSYSSFLPVQVIPGLLSISYATNTGIAFGILPGSNVSLGILGVVVAGTIIWLRKSFSARAEIYAAALILGGTLGNLIDRAFRGAVVDYISFRGFPSFNIADAALTVGAALIIASYISEKLRKK